MHANESKSFIVERKVCLLVYIYVFLNGAGLSRDQCLVFNKNDKKKIGLLVLLYLSLIQKKEDCLCIFTI